MRKLTAKEKSDLRAKGSKLIVSASIRGDTLCPLLIENICCFMAKHPLVKVGMLEGTLAERKKLAKDLAAATDSRVVELSSKHLLLYRTPIFNM